MKKELGIVIRYSDMLGDERVNTINEHNRIFNAKGTVYVGKYGQPVGTKYLDLCCQEEYGVMLIMVKKSVGRTYEAHQARIKSGLSSKPPAILVPSYVNVRKDIRCWFELGSELKPMSKNDLQSWFVKSSGLPLLESIAASMSGLFYVTQDKEMAKRSRNKSSRGPVDIFEEDFDDAPSFESGDEFMDITNFSSEDDGSLNEDNY